MKGSTLDLVKNINCQGCILKEIIFEIGKTSSIQDDSFNILANLNSEQKR